jgi:hypothetical protein
MQKVLSPSPKALYSPNWPVLKVQALAAASSTNSRRKVRTPGASWVILPIRMRWGR